MTQAAMSQYFQPLRFPALVSLAGFALFSAPATAGDLSLYGAGIGDAIWQFEGGTEQCELHHPIPSYGIAHFKRDNRDRETLSLQTFRQVAAVEDQGIVQRRLPPWRHSKPDNRRLEVDLRRGYKPLDLQGDPVHWLLRGLQNGFEASLEYQADAYPRSQVRISLAPSNFQAEYEKYLSCIRDLAPPQLTLAEAGFGNVLFATDSHALRPHFRNELVRLAAYLAKHPEILALQITGHADSSGKEIRNLPLSERRARSVADFLLGRKVDAARVAVDFQGSSSPVSENKTRAGRSLNRRAELRFVYEQKSNMAAESQTDPPPD